MLQIVSPKWLFRIGRLAVCYRKDRPRGVFLFRHGWGFCIADVGGAWDHLFWRFFWYRPNRK